MQERREGEKKERKKADGRKESWGTLGRERVQQLRTAMARAGDLPRAQGFLEAAGFVSPDFDRPTQADEVLAGGNEGGIQSDDKSLRA